MFPQDRQQLRQMYHQVWQKSQDNAPLSALETLISQVINQHPEYHRIFNSETSLAQDYFAEQGDTNPFLHMGLHIAIQEQISTDRPVGIGEIYQQLTHKWADGHQAQHQMMNCLNESLYVAQRNQKMPSETSYLAALQQLLTK